MAVVTIETQQNELKRLQVEKRQAFKDLQDLQTQKQMTDVRDSSPLRRKIKAARAQVDSLEKSIQVAQQQVREARQRAEAEARQGRRERFAQLVKAYDGLPAQVAQLETDRGRIAASLETAQADHARQEAEAVRLGVLAEREPVADATRKAEQADEKLFKLSRLVARKQAALGAVTADLDAARAELAEAEAAHSLARLGEIIAEAGKGRGKVTQTKARTLQDLYTEAARLIADLRGRFHLYQPLESPGALLVAQAVLAAWDLADCSEAEIVRLARRGVELAGEVRRGAALSPVQDDGAARIQELIAGGGDF